MSTKPFTPSSWLLGNQIRMAEARFDAQRAAIAAAVATPAETITALKDALFGVLHANVRKNVAEYGEPAYSAARRLLMALDAVQPPGPRTLDEQIVDALVSWWDESEGIGGPTAGSLFDESRTWNDVVHEAAAARQAR